MKELNDDPELRDTAIDAMQHEGGIQSNMEQLFNYAAMRHMTINQALHSGQYGPVNRGQISGNISDKTRAAGEAALQKVGGGSNITDYATDQGMAGDPNFATYMANPDYYNMHKVEGAWFSAHGERGRKWAQQQREADRATAALPNASADVSAKRLDETGERIRTDNAARGGKGNLDETGERMRSDYEARKRKDDQSGGDSFNDRWNALKEHQSMREEMERPIKLAIEAPQPPPLYSHRQRMARQQSRYQSDDMLQAPRYNSQIDIGFA
jgi:hypothetical protein